MTRERKCPLERNGRGTGLAVSTLAAGCVIGQWAKMLLSHSQLPYVFNPSLPFVLAILG